MQHHKIGHDHAKRPVTFREMRIEIMRAFVKLRLMLASNKELARKFAALETRIDSQDQTIVEILAAIRQLMAPPEPKKKRPIGFVVTDAK
jgi:hypothetical protein